MMGHAELYNRIIESYEEPTPSKRLPRNSEPA